MRQKGRVRKDVQQVRVMKERDGNILTSESGLKRLKSTLSMMNEENEREGRVEVVEIVEQEVEKICKNQV